MLIINYYFLRTKVFNKHRPCLLCTVQFYVKIISAFKRNTVMFLAIWVRDPCSNWSNPLGLNTLSIKLLLIQHTHHQWLLCCQTCKQTNSTIVQDVKTVMDWPFLFYKSIINYYKQCDISTRHSVHSENKEPWTSRFDHCQTCLV